MEQQLLQSNRHSSSSFTGKSPAGCCTRMRYRAITLPFLSAVFCAPHATRV